MTDHWFEAIAEHTGAAYLRYSFTKGTAQEVDFLVGVLGLEPGMRVLDVGCGPGRHTNELARRGVDALGVDISERFVELAREQGEARFERMDARQLPFDREFDAVISLCQGGFGLLRGTEDDEAMRNMARALKPGGRAAVSAFSSYFSVKYQTDATFDAAAATATEVTEVKDEAGVAKPVELHTTCYTPRELGFLAERAGFEVEAVWSVEPGAYRRDDPTTESAEFLLLARLPAE